NIDSESHWVRYQLYHFLLNKMKANEVEVNIKDLHEYRTYLINELESNKIPPFKIKDKEKELKETEEKIKNLDKDDLITSRSGWVEIINHVKQQSDFKTLFHKLFKDKGKNLSVHGDYYAKALLYDQFARRLPRERSLENLGLVNLVYPALDN